MTRFEVNSKYFIKNNNQYYLDFLCTRRDERTASFSLVNIHSSVTLSNCPVLFSILEDFYQNINGKMIEISVTSKIEMGGEREVAYSNEENYLWIDSLNLV